MVGILPKKLFRIAPLVQKPSGPKRLISIHTLRFFEPKNKTPLYATLSHRWTENELSYNDYLVKGKRKGAGYDKVARFCQFMRTYNDEHPEEPDIEYVWIDTCCINKCSSAELSESINSMAEWYQGSEFCVAYLSDVPPSTDSHDYKSSLRSSEWFRRGWTLQELLFPDVVFFADAAWTQILTLGDGDLHAELLISDITGIPVECISHTASIFDYSVAARMSWAAGRSTTRKEDEAYSLMSLAGVNMPLIYGEGDRAFIRLQEEIIRQCDDESIFAWTDGDTTEKSPNDLYALLAHSPSQFAGCSKVICANLEDRPPHSIINRGLQLEAQGVTFRFHAKDVTLLQLNCYLVPEGSNDDSDGDPCLIALAEGIDSDRGPKLARIWPFDLGDQLWETAQTLRESGMTMAPKQIYHICTEPTTISRAREHQHGIVGSQNQNWPTLSARFNNILPESASNTSSEGTDGSALAVSSDSDASKSD